MRENIKEKIKNVKNPKSLQVNLTDMEINDNEIQEIMTEIIKTKSYITKLFLKDNQITDHGAVILSKAIESLPQLESIDLQFNQLDELGIKSLLSHNKIKFDFHGNKIKDTGQFAKIEQNIFNQNK